MARRIAAALAMSAVLASASDPIRKYNIDTDSITVGGLSAGAFMAVQLHVAYSDLFTGAAVFAGGPFYCAQGQLTTAVTTCMNPILDKPNAQALADEAGLAEISGRIAGLGNLSTSQVFVYSGALDSVVKQTVVQTTAEFYNIFVKPEAGGNVTTSFNVLSEHCYPTNGSYGESCSQLGSPYIGKCGYDGAGIALRHLIGLTEPRSPGIKANLLEFDQTPFGGGQNSLDTQGYIYVPTQCASGQKCRLHVSLHGCQQTRADIQADYAALVGLNQWAESNGIIIVYPYVVKSELFPSNPEGCFDWWGYAGPDYAYRSGVQMRFVVSIVNALAGTSFEP